MTSLAVRLPVVESSEMASGPRSAMRERSPGRFTVIVKPTVSCNLACTYCYEGDPPPTKVMSFDTLEHLTEQAVAHVGSSRPLHFLWHGGEPLLAGLEFYRRAIAIQDRLKGDVKISNSMQTNGTLLTEEMAGFFQQHGFTLGFSLDGDRQIHNRYRPAKGSRPSFDDVMRGMAIAREYKIGGTGAIAVLSRATLPYIADIYAFFKRTGINLQVNPLIESGRGCRDDLVMDPSDYGRAMVQLFDRWVGDSEPPLISVEPLEEAIGSRALGRTRSCTYGGSCRTSYVAIDSMGAIYPCSRFNGDSFRLGHVEEGGLEAALSSTIQLQLLQRQAETLPGCEQCEYTPVCNGGCMHNAFAVTGSVMERDPYCDSYHELFTHIKRRVVEALDGAAAAFSVEHAQDATIILDRQVSLGQIDNPVLRRAIAKRQTRGGWCIISDHSEAWPDHREHRDHSESYAERYNEYSVYTEYSVQYRDES